MITLLLIASLDFEGCNDVFNEALTRGLVKTHTTREPRIPIHVVCALDRVRIQTPRRDKSVDLTDTQASIRPQLIALSILGTLADLRTPLRAQDPVKRLLSGGFALGLAITTAVLLGVGLAVILPAIRAPNEALIKLGLGLSIASAAIFPGAAVPFGFWLYENALPP